MQWIRLNLLCVTVCKNLLMYHQAANKMLQKLLSFTLQPLELNPSLTSSITAEPVQPDEEINPRSFKFKGCGERQDMALKALKFVTK